MTKELQAALKHRFVKVDQIDGALVIAPAGDIHSFPRKEFLTEMERVGKLVKDPDFDRLVIDLTGSTYYGSEMIGLFIQYREDLGPTGRMGLCNVPPDTELVLSRLNLGEKWEIYGDRNDALSAITGKNPKRKVQLLALGFAALCLVAVTAGVTWLASSPKNYYKVFPHPVASDYGKLVSTWHDFLEMHAEAAGGKQFESFGTDATELVEQIRSRHPENDDSLKSRASLLKATGSLAVIAKDPGDQENEEVEHFEELMKTVEADLETETGVDFKSIED